jgi:N-acetylmuramoyl-L-alanine amidase
MAQNYLVQQGDQLSALADQFGFRDYATIWNHPNNAELKKKRKAHVLYPGDTLYIPDKIVKIEQGVTTALHSFRLIGGPLKLRLVLQDFDNQPMPNLDCELEVEGAVLKLKTNSKGLIEAPIPKTARNGSLRVPDLELEVPVKIGYLDPTEEDSGWLARLVNLGYSSGSGGDSDDDSDDDQLRYAIEEFQCDHGLEVNGELDGPTRAALEKFHGV